jgi:hypothetical protein
MTSQNTVYSDEAIKEATDYLHSPDAFLRPDGGLVYGINDKIAKLVLANFTRGLAA